ncbi:MAG: hypothetical protein AAGH53_10965 [Pseudomonadota bacterium]
MVDKSKKWFSLQEIDANSVEKAETVADNVSVEIEALAKESISLADATKEWTSWTTNFPTGKKPDVGYEVDF